jgi:ABC-2 type transport system ATP-binding protein
MGDAGGAAAAAQALDRAGPCRDLEVHGEEVVARTNGGAEALPAVLVALDRAGHTVRSAEAARPTLDDVFLALTGRSLREGVDDPNATDPDARGASTDQAPTGHTAEPTTNQSTTDQPTTAEATTDLSELQR